MKTTPRYTDYEAVNLILIEANAYGIREEVQKQAKEILRKNPTIYLITAYQRAFSQLLKTYKQ